MRAAISLLTVLLLATGSAQAAEGEPPSCAKATEPECLHSAACTLVKEQGHGNYRCRDAAGRCEQGFRQAGQDILTACTDKPGCELIAADCYCPPGLNCACGGGPPAQCVEEKLP